MREKQKIVHITESFAAGVFAYIVQLANELVNRGFDVTIVYSRRPDTVTNPQAYFHEDVKLIEIKMVRNVSPLNDMQAVFALVNILRLEQPDALHLHSSKAGVIGRIASIIPGVDAKVFYSPHGLSFLREDVSAIKRGLFRFIENVAALLGGTIVASSKSEFDCIREDISHANVVLVENGVDFKDLPERQIDNTSVFVVGTLNRITAQKNPGLFASIAQSLPDDYHFVWIGGGDDDGRRELEESGVEVFEWMEIEDALSRMSCFDVFLQTSRWEGMPLALIQAQAIGVPVVATNVVGNKDVVINGETGYLCSSKDEFVGRLKELHEDKDLRLSMGKEAYLSARNRFSLDKMTSSLIALYK